MKPNRAEIHQKYNGKCAYCGQSVKIERMQVDHITPKYLQGTDDISNLNPSCYSCNNYKDTYSLEVFRRQLANLINKNRHYLYASKSKQLLAENYGAVIYKEWDGLFYFEKEKQHEKTN